MSLEIGHFALGVGLTTGVILATRLNKKVKNTEPIRMIGGGIWAIIPDAQKLISSLKILHNGWWTDIFWFHRFLDSSVDPTDSVLVSTIFIVFMLLMLVICWRVERKSKPS